MILVGEEKTFEEWEAELNQPKKRKMTKEEFLKMRRNEQLKRKALNVFDRLGKNASFMMGSGIVSSSSSKKKQGLGII